MKTKSLYSSFYSDNELWDTIVNMATLGQNLKTLRTARDWTIGDLARESGVSTGMLSGIEQDKKNPTIVVASQIAKALECSLSQLIGELATPSGVIRRNERRVTLDPATGCRHELLSPSFVGRGVDIALFTVPGGTATGEFPAHPAGTLEHVTLLSGCLEATVGRTTFALAAGDSLTYPGDVPHLFYNPGTEDCQFFLVSDVRVRGSR